MWSYQHAFDQHVQFIAHKDIFDYAIGFSTLLATVFAGIALYMSAMEFRLKRLEDLKPPLGLNSEVLNLRAVFVDIQNGGKEAPWFQSQVNQSILRRIKGYYPAVRDSELYEYLKSLDDKFTDCFSYAPGYGQLAKVENLSRIQKQVDFASQGIVLCDVTSLRITELTIKK